MKKIRIVAAIAAAALGVACGVGLSLASIAIAVSGVWPDSSPIIPLDLSMVVCGSVGLVAGYMFGIAVEKEIEARINQLVDERLAERQEPLEPGASMENMRPFRIPAPWEADERDQA